MLNTISSGYIHTHEFTRSPSPVNMLRGIDSHEAENDGDHHAPRDHLSTNTHAVNHNNSSSSSNNTRDNGALTRRKSLSTRIKSAIGANVVGVGCIPAKANLSYHNNNNNNGDVNGSDDLFSIIADVPFFPPQEQQKTHCVEQQVSRTVPEPHKKPLHREEELVVDFPSRHHNNNHTGSSLVSSNHHTLLSVHTNTVKTHHTLIHTDTAQHTQHHDRQHHHSPIEIQSMAEQPSHTFPGFALYNMARVYYILGKYTKALDTTTDCLAFQKRALTINENNNASCGDASTSNTRNDSSNGGGFGNVRNFIKGGNIASGATFPFNAGDSTIVLPAAQHPIAIANSTAKMLSHYPTHACVAQTLLLRARVLAVCGLYGHGSDDDNDESPTFSYGGDHSLVHQAIQHVEMAVAIQRKISTLTNVNLDLTQWELATPMVLLGVLKAEIRNFKDADGAYEEALLILRSVRQFHHEEQRAAKEGGDDTMAKEHSELLRRITREMANVLYLKGRSFQCRRLYSDAFKSYNKCLGLLRSVGASKNDAATRKIIRCMKKSSALEKLLSEYWDDANRI